MTARHLLISGAALAAAVLPAAAHGAGLPVSSAHSSRIGATTPGGSERVIAKRTGADTTVIALRSGVKRRIAGRWDVPAVSLDNGTTGLSADGGTLVLVHRMHRYPSKKTRLVVLDARRLTVQRHITLRGFFTVDAISPDGGSAYLIQYTSENFLDYRVRRLDTGSGRLAVKDVVDPREPGEQMGGMPYTRVMSPDGRWAYTLYGGGEETFIHALDTAGATAACIDLDMLSPGEDSSQMRLALTPDGLVVRYGHRRVAVVDTKTFAVRDTTTPAAPVATARPQAPAPAPAPAPDKDGFPWLVIPIVAGVAALGAAALRLARRPGGHGEDVTITTRVP